MNIPRVTPLLQLKRCRYKYSLKTLYNDVYKNMREYDALQAKYDALQANQFNLQ